MFTLQSTLHLQLFFHRSEHNYPQGIAPVKIFVEQKYVRAVIGGTGFTKAGANYAISLKGQEEAAEQGYVQTLWLDGVERKYVEEVGSMNVFFKIDGEVVTPALVGSITWRYYKNVNY